MKIGVISVDIWCILSIVADFAGIISLVLGVITLIKAVGIKTSLRKHIEKSDYSNDIDNQINELQSYYDTLVKDKSLYKKELLIGLEGQLDDILIGYETILPKKLLNEIKSLITHINNKCQNHLLDEDAKIKCTQDLRKICAKLRKEKKML